MPFKIKDLMIEVTSIAKQCFAGTVCHQPSLCGGACSYLAISLCGIHCSHLHSACAGCTFVISNPCTLHCTHIGSIVCPGGSGFPTTPYQLEEDPAVLKEQLKAALKAVEDREKEIADSLAVKTLADAELLEGKLGEALEEIKRLKKTLK